jgi:hypothetical protein
MKELIESIAHQSGLTVETATTALNTVSQFVKEQYPLLSNTIDRFWARARFQIIIKV